MQNKPILPGAGRRQLEAFLPNEPFPCTFAFSPLPFSFFTKRTQSRPACNTFPFAEVLIHGYNHNRNFRKNSLFLANQWTELEISALVS